MAQFGQGISLKGAKGDSGLTPIIKAEPPSGSAAEGQCWIDTLNFTISEYTNGAYVTSASFRGVQGIQGEVGFFGYGNGAPDTTVYSGDSNGVYFQSNGEVWSYTKANGWVDTGENFIGPKGDRGDVGPAGTRGNIRYVRNYAAPTSASDIAALDPQPMAGDEWVQLGDPNSPIVSYFS